MALEVENGSPKSESPDDILTITVPQTIRIERRFVEGEVGHIIVEYNSKTSFGITAHQQELLSRGARIFLTDEDKTLTLHSEESLRYSQNPDDREGMPWGVI